GTEVRQREHADEHDLRLRARVAQLIDDRLDVRFADGRIDTAEHVVRTRLDDRDIERLTQQPTDTTARAGRRLAADPGIDDAIRQPRLLDLPFDQQRKRPL